MDTDVIVQIEREMDMTERAFYVVPLCGGIHLFASEILSECVDFAARHAQVAIVDMFGQVWLTV